MVRQKAKAKDSSNINGYVAQPTPRQQHSGNWTSDSHMHRNFYNNSMPATRSTQYLPTMPEYWRNICNNWVGALPRAAAPTPPAASSKKLARLRRELMNRPNVRHTNHILQTQSQPHCPNVNYCPPQWRGNAADANVYLRNSEQRTQAGTTRACQSNCSRLVYVNSCPMPNAHQETQRLPKQRKNLYNSFNFGKCASSIIGFCPDATTDSEGRSLAPIAQTQEAQNADAAAEFVPVSKLNNGTATDIEEALSYERYIFGHSAEQEELNLNEQWQPNQEITPETVISAAEPQVISIPAKRRKKSTRPKKQQQYEKNANRENSKAASSDEQELSVLRQLSQLMSNMSDTQMQPKSSEAQLESMPRQVNLNKLFQENNVKGLESNPLWDSLMQIVVRMCSDETEEHNVNKSEADKRERLSAGCDTERQQKQYSIYLVVSSDDENENDEPINEPQRVERHTQYESNYGDGDNNFGNSQLSQSSIKSNDYNNTKEPIKGRCSLCNHECGNALPKKRRFKKRKTATYGDSHKTRPPLHWPKPEYSKVKSHAMQVLRNRCGTKLHKSSASAHWSTWDIHAKLPYELRRAYSQTRFTNAAEPWLETIEIRHLCCIKYNTTAMPNLINRNVNWQGCLEKGSGFPISKLTTYGSVALNRLGTQYLKSPSKRFIGGDTEYEYYPNTTFLRNPIVVKNHQFGLSHKAHSFQQMPKESYSDYENPQTWDNGNNNKKKPYKHKKPGYTEKSNAGEDWGFNTCKMGAKCDCNSFEAPERAAPERAAPERAAPERPVPERAAPERSVPERAAPERPIPERAPLDFGATERETASNSQPSKQHPRHYAEGVENSTYPYSCLLRNPMLDPKRQPFNTNEYTDNSSNRGSRGNNNNHQNEPEPQANKSPKNNGAGQNSIKFDPCCYQESCPNRKYDDRERPARGNSRKQRSNFEDSSAYNNYPPPQARQSSARRRTSAADENYAYNNNHSNVRDPISAASDGSPINATYKKPKNEFMVERIYNAHYPTQYEYSTLGNAVAKVPKKNGKTYKRPQPNGSTYTKDNNGQCPRRPTKNPAKSSKKQADTNDLMYTNESNCYHPKNTIVQCASLNHYAPEPAANNLNFNSNRCDQCEHCNQSNNMGNSRKNMSREKRLQESTRYSNRRNSAGTAGSTSTARSNCADAVANKNRCASSSSRRSCADAPCSTNRSASSSSRRKSANAAGNKKKPTSSSIRRKSAGASGNITNTNVLPKNGILSKKPKETNNSVVLKIEQRKDEQSAKEQTNNDKPCSEAQKVLPTTKSVISCPALNRYKAMQYKMKCVGPKKSNSHTTVNSNDNIPRKFKDTMGSLENYRSYAGTCTPFVKSVVRAIEENIEKSKQEAALQSSAFIMPCQLELRRQFKSYAKKEAGCAHAYGNCCRRAVCSNPRRFWYNFWNWKKFFYCGAHHKLTSSSA